MTRITVMSADNTLGQSIVTELARRERAVTAVVRDPTRWPTPDAQVRLMRGDVLDLTYPEVLIEACDVLVVPLGSPDGEPVDFGADLHAATALCRASTRLKAAGAYFVLVGQPSRLAESLRPGDRQALADARQLGELTAVRLYAMYLQLPWTYVSPSGNLHSSDRHRQLPATIAASPSEEAGTPQTANYLGAVVDAIVDGREAADGAARSARTVGDLGGAPPLAGTSTPRRR